MPIIYLRHPLHGVKIASLDLEAEYDERNGWERFDLEQQPQSQDASQSAPANSLISEIRRRPRRADTFA